MAIRRIRLCVALTGVLSLCAAGDSNDEHIIRALRDAAVPIRDGQIAFGDFERAFERSTVLALGEATHGQHESFELKRRITMHLIRNHGFRIVAYEASASRAVACDDYINSRTDDLNAAMSGLGMMIWQIEENADLLRDLRAWNATAVASDRVRFFGIDVQDPSAAAKRLSALLADANPILKNRVTELAAQIEPAVQKRFAGDSADFEKLAAAMSQCAADVESWARQSAPPNAELTFHMRELQLAIEMFRTPGGRDKAMAEMLVRSLRRADEKSKVVVWAHNAHVTRGALRYIGTDELGMGGHVAKELGDQYYAIGFAFGGGGFNALAQDAQGKWQFRAYTIPTAPPGSLESAFIAADRGDFLVDLQSLPKSGKVADWLAAPHGQVWFGGYQMPDDVAAATSDASKLMPTILREEFDGVAFLKTTTPSKPRRK